MSEERSLRAQGPLPLPATSHTAVGLSPRVATRSATRPGAPAPWAPTPGREIESVR